MNLTICTQGAIICQAGNILSKEFSALFEKLCCCRTGSEPSICNWLFSRLAFKVTIIRSSEHWKVTKFRDEFSNCYYKYWVVNHFCKTSNHLSTNLLKRSGAYLFLTKLKINEAFNGKSNNRFPRIMKSNLPWDLNYRLVSVLA